jgi:ribonuclease E
LGQHQAPQCAANAAVFLVDLHNLNPIPPQPNTDAGPPAPVLERDRMKKEMLINVLQPEECRIAIIEDGVLEELYVERTSHESYTGNIYKGRIVNLEPAIQAAFVDFSVGRNGFLHVSDVDAQYFDRKEGTNDEAGAREPERERKREPRRGRGRDDRRRPAATEPFDASDGGMPPPPPRLEERSRERSREREFEREPDRGRERERPDQSVKGRRDRSEPPRRFGEGLVEPPDEPIEPIEPFRAIERAPAQSRLPFDENAPTAEPETASSKTTPWPEILEPFGGQDVSWPIEREPEFGGAAEPAVEHPPKRDESEQPFGTESLFAEPFDPDLPPSRTQRQRSSVVPTTPSEIEGPEQARYPELPSPPPSRDAWDQDDLGFGDPDVRSSEARERRRGRGRGRARQSPPPGRPRPAPPAEPEEPHDPDINAGPIADVPRTDEDFGDISQRDLPPRRRGGRAAIRSRGGEWDRPREVAPAQDFGSERPPRGQTAPDEFETMRRRPPTPDRPEEPERRRAGTTPELPRERERGRERVQPHDRAGEPGYVPRRERLRSGDSTFGAEIFPPGSEWPEGDLDSMRRSETLPQVPDVSDEGEPDLFGDTGTVDATRPEARRRRRRRGRRRESEGPKRGPSSPTPLETGEPDLDEFATDVEPSRSYARHRSSDRDSLGDLDELDLDEVGAHERDTFDDDDFDGEEPVARAVAPVDEEIDLELEQEIRREIEEIEELEREMGLRGPAEARPRRGEEPSRGGRFTRGRGLVKPPIQEIFRRGDEVLVQVIKESIGTKGPTLSTYISIPGRYLVLMPGLNRVGVSRKIVDEGQRRKLREIMHELNPPKGLGFIVRTAGLERTKRELARDLAYLLRLWKVILRRIKKTKAPAPIYQESDMIIRTIRDIFNSEIDTIWIDEASAFERAQDFLRVVMPRFVNRLKLYDEKVPLFHKYGIEDEIAKIQRRHVPLPEGGSIVIDPTEALVAIDVNSGNFRVEDDAERTAYEMNLRAAKEIARQLRLRDLGGVIVNDFIDMREERHRRGVERALREAIKRDRARTKVLRMSAFGLIEMTRQRIRPSLKRSIYEDCHHCTGAGVVKTAESMAIDVMRLLALATHRDEIRRIVISVHPSVAAYLGNRKRKEIARIESECNMTIQIGFDPNAPAEHLKIECFDASGNEIRMIPSPASSHKRGH